ncbi:MAG: hypothetical protein ABIG94_11460 [Pseudomonadota bacterium]
MGKIIPYRVLARQQHLSFLKHQGREYREREDYLARTRKLLFQIEAQMRQAEVLQLDTFRQVAHHFQIPLTFPDLGDRLGLQRFFATNPFILALKEFFAARLTAEECYQQLMELKEKLTAPAKNPG